MPRTVKRRTIKRKYRRKSKSKPKRKVVAKRKRRTKSKSKRVTKRVTQAKRRVKLINKTIKRVQTKLADEVVTMRRMKPLQSRRNNITTGAQDLDIRQSILDGQLCLNKYLGLPVKYSDWWNINAFHGYISPRYWVPKISQFDSSFDDRNWEAKKPWESHSDLYLQDTISAPNNNNDVAPGEQVLDIRAYDQKEIPFLPCVPKWIERSDYYQSPENRLKQFCRKGERIKIRSNYMRFNFYVKPGMKDIIPEMSSGDTYDSETHMPAVSPAPAYSNIRGVPGAIRSFRIAAKSMAKARIIVVKRTDDHDGPINLNDFLKDNNPYTMGDEGYRMSKYFYRKYKTDNDIVVNTDGSAMKQTTDAVNAIDSGKVQYEVTKLKDLSNSVQRGLHKVQIMYDKVHNLRVGGETVVKLSMMKGTVLTYEKENPAFQEFYTSSLGGFSYFDNTGTANPELKPNPGLNDSLPTHTNTILRDMSKNPTTNELAILKAKHNEFVPKGAKYAAFLLLMNQKCSTEYQIFQKFEFDN